MPLNTVAQALSILKQNVTSNNGRNSSYRATADSLNYITSDNIFAKYKQPPFNCSVMDGFAVNFLEAQAHNWLLAINATIAAGATETDLATSGAIKIATGAKLPEFADTVVPVEQSSLVATNLVKLQVVEQGNFVRKAAEEFSIGDCLLSKNSYIDAQKLALLKAQGITNIAVVDKPKVAIVTSGDEVSNTNDLQGSQIYNSNRILLQALCKQNYCQVVAIEHLKDDFKQTLSLLKSLINTADIVFSCGGVSVGDCDYIGKALAELIAIKYKGILLKPGKPNIYGSSGNTHFMAFPGNIGSVFVGFNLFARYLLNLLVALPLPKVVTIAIANIVNLPKAIARQQFLFCNYQYPQVTVLPNQSSGSIFSVGSCNSLLQIPPLSNNVDTNQCFKLHLLD